MLIEVPDDLGEEFCLLVSSRTFETTPSHYAQRLIERDKLTGCHTGNQFEADLTHQLRPGPLAEPALLRFLCVDIGGLRAYNDTYGLPGGDRVIRAVADALHKSYPSEMIYRVGGNEFVADLSSSGLQSVTMPEGTVFRYSVVTITLPRGRGWLLEYGGAVRLHLGRGLSEARPEGNLFH